MVEVTIDFIRSSGVLVILAASTQAVAYLFRSQIRLRILLFIGTLLYIAYYFTAASSPLWPAIFGGSIIAATSLFGLCKLLISQSHHFIPKSQLYIFDMFTGIEPGIFQTFMKLGVVRTLEDQELMSKIDEVPENLYFILGGKVDVYKKM